MKRKLPHTPKKLSKTPLKKLVLLGLLILFGVAGILWGFDKAGVINLPFLSNNGTTTDITNGINYGPPTKQEKQDTEEFKKDLTNQDSNNETPTTPGQKQTVTPIISSWGQVSSTQNVEVSGYVTGVYENGGTCTANLEKDGQTVSQSQAATLNAQSISCGFISIDRSRLSAGSWKTTLSYSSAAAEGTSQSLTVEVK